MFASPTILKGLSDLQVLDNIIGHVDRNPGNIVYEMDTAGQNVIAIKGIDNDDTFAKRWKPQGVDITIKTKTPGVPPIVDADTALKILAITSKNINSTLIEPTMGELTEDEKRATRARFLAVRNEIINRIKTGNIASDRQQADFGADLNTLAKAVGIKVQNVRIKSWSDNAVLAAHNDENSYFGVRQTLIQNIALNPQTQQQSLFTYN